MDNANSPRHPAQFAIERFWTVNPKPQTFTIPGGGMLFLPGLRDQPDGSVVPAGDVEDGFKKYPEGMNPVYRPDARPYTRKPATKPDEWSLPANLLYEVPEIDRHEDDDGV